VTDRKKAVFSSPRYHHTFEQSASRSRPIAIANVRRDGDKCANDRGAYDNFYFSANARRVRFAVPPLSVTIEQIQTSRRMWISSRRHKAVSTARCK